MDAYSVVRVYESIDCEVVYEGNGVRGFIAVLCANRYARLFNYWHDRVLPRFHGHI